MSFFNLKLNRKTDDLIILSIPLLSRFPIFFFTALILGTMIFDREVTLIPLIIFLILLFSGCYKESWIFDRKNQRVTYGFGLLFLYKKTVISFDLIENFKVEGFVKGSLTKKPSEEISLKKNIFQKEFFKFSLMNKNIGELTIDTEKGRNKDRLCLNAEDISRFCNKKLQK